MRSAEADHAQRRGARRAALVSVHPGVRQRQLDVRDARVRGIRLNALEHEADVAVADVASVVLVEPADVDAVRSVGAASSACRGTRGCSSASSCRFPRRP